LRPWLHCRSIRLLCRESLAAALQARTLTGFLDPAGAAAAFDALHAHIRNRYPLVQQKLTREVIGSHTLLYTWQGSDAAVPPLCLAGPPGRGAGRTGH
jgi:carboxypeptidase PM20D1